MKFRRTTTIYGCIAAVVLMLFLFSARAAEEQLQLKGSGASFPYPIYTNWFKDFSRKHGNVKVLYQDKGSGGGIQDFLHGAVDFAASGTPLTAEEIAAIEQGVVLLPLAAEQVALTYNLKGVDGLRLPRDVYPAIFLGEITNWNHPKIAAANPGIELPDMPITVVTRSDPSGTTDILTNHLCAISAAFEKGIGRSRQPRWPGAARFIATPGNQGVATRVKHTPGAIGYVEYSFSKLLALPVARLQNKSGSYVAPGPQASAAALSEVEFPRDRLPISGAPNLVADIPDPDGESAYPVIGLSWLLLYARQDSAKAAALRKLVIYILSDEAQQQARELGFIPLPQELRQQARETVGFIR
ncbi:phosphate ABC transporter substrate-binding protein PstS [Microbulbifer thermotolerans]|uniref:phosphate ABC transporter substrate-binding protein PstS n=1 Tax=Microbulbifer thermotolerans TaxID=252514 RepID=UPI0022497CE7|nr:phosphate ABC transporter substrate-binding protein PstS [Microbulbifer thermotolerans]MCX2832827.1 phosphate ABC transporter substrate-binding protein PstS [Microbulbifer thermotolerans]